MAIPASPLHKKPTLGLDLQGGLEVTLQAVPPADRKLTSRRPRPLGRHHAQPGRQARCQRAVDLQAGKRPDRDPAPGRQGPGGGCGDHRNDGAARALRPRDVARRTVDLDSRRAGREPVVVRTPRAGSGAGEGRHLRGLLHRQPQDEARRLRAVRLRGGGDPEVRRQATGRTGALRRAQGHGRRHLRRGRSRVPRRRRRGCRAGPHLLLPLQVRPAERPADDRRGPEALGHARGLRHEPGRRQPADRDDGVHRRGRGQVREDHPRRVDPRQAPAAAAALRDRPRPRDQDVPADRLHRQQPERAASAGAAPRSRASTRSGRRRTSRSCSRPARCR